MAKAKSILTSKECRSCGDVKPLSAFYRLADGAGGVRAWCRTCATARDREYRSRRSFDPNVTEKSCTRCRLVKPRDAFAKGQATGGLHSWCRECSSAYAKERRATLPRNSEREARWRQQGIDVTWEHFEELLAAQSGRCAICNRDEIEVGRSHVLDHDHQTGKPRGVLCSTCNSAIGLLNDSPDLLRRALDYLGS